MRNYGIQQLDDMHQTTIASINDVIWLPDQCNHRVCVLSNDSQEFGLYIAFLASRDFNVRAAAGSRARDVAVMVNVGRGTALHIASIDVAESLSAVEREAFPATVRRTWR